MGLAARLRGYKLRANIALGRQTWGRQGPPRPDEGGGLLVRMPVAATISAVVIRADGTREDLGEIYSGTGEISNADLDQLEALAGRNEP